MKADGSPLDDWAGTADARWQKAQALQKAGQPLPNAERPCRALTTGNHGAQRPCLNMAIPGLPVCRMHGGSTKAAKSAAKRRFIEELDPTITRLIQLRDQSEHMPTALGASQSILNRVLGKPDAVDKDKGAGKPTVIVGIAIGGIPKDIAARSTVRLLPGGMRPPPRRRIPWMRSTRSTRSSQ
jgi:hypothetical protein